jgi:thiol-disulfide isomerase/thioredoxin
MTRPFAVLAACVCAALFLAGCESQSDATQLEITATVSKFADLDSAITAAKGKVVLVDCWATWCPPCVQSFPELVAKHKKYADRGLAVIAVSIDDPDKIASVNRFLSRQRAAFTNFLLVKDDAAIQGFSVKFGYEGSIPHAALFARSGERVWSGHPADEGLKDLIEAELAK